MFRVQIWYSKIKNSQIRHSSNIILKIIYLNYVDEKLESRIDELK